ncbi:DUF2975 domain-containing protein [Rhizobium sp. NRK18]|uniref:DUF2975 domain-containing protein n=1 Tax=Rhizobium sp. NRK18 TaxID=2964667 RepID=UPI0021C321B0|nr:hypothetical protein [Rhizobium sp. NRK18]MCQ2005488.1 hypothetical protein [Rhizobium sp. NRK18]
MHHDSLEQIRRLSQKLRLFVVLMGMLLTVAFLYVAWRLSFDLEGFVGDASGFLLGGSATAVTLTPGTATGLIILAALNAIIALGALQAIWSLSGRYEAGDLFSPRCGRLLRRAGLFSLTGAVSSILSKALATLLLTFAYPPGQRLLTLGIGSTELFLLLLAGLLFVLGHIMMVAGEIAAENRSFV